MKKRKRPYCTSCKVSMLRGIALEPSLPDFLGRLILHGPATIPVFKCPKCGLSVTLDHDTLPSEHGAYVSAGV